MMQVSDGAPRTPVVAGRSLQPPFVLKLPVIDPEYSVARQRRLAAVLAAVHALLFVATTIVVAFSYRQTQLWPLFVATDVAFLASAVTWAASYRKLRAGSGTVGRG